MTPTEAAVIFFLFAVLFAISIWALLTAYGAKKEAGQKTQNLPPAEWHQIETKMAQLAESRVDHLLAGILGSPTLSGIDFLSLSGVQKKISAKVQDMLDDPPDELQEDLDHSIETIVKQVSNSAEFQEKLRTNLLESLNGKTDEIVEQIFDLDDDNWEDAYTAIRDKIEELVPEWIAEELQKPDSNIRKTLTESITSQIEDIFEDA